MPKRIDSEELAKYKKDILKNLKRISTTNDAVLTIKNTDLTTPQIKYRINRAAASLGLFIDTCNVWKTKKLVRMEITGDTKMKYDVGDAVIVVDNYLWGYCGIVNDYDRFFCRPIGYKEIKKYGAAIYTVTLDDYNIARIPENWLLPCNKKKKKCEGCVFQFNCWTN